MIFKEWLAKANELIKLMKHNPFGNPSEAVIIGSEVYEIEATPSGVVFQNTSRTKSLPYDVRYLRGDYAKHKKALDKALENLTEKVKESKESSDKIFEVIGSQQIPKAVLGKISSNPSEFGEIGSAGLVVAELKERLISITKPMTEFIGDTPLYGTLSFEVLAQRGELISMVIDYSYHYLDFRLDKTIQLTLHSDSGRTENFQYGNLKQVITILANMEVIEKAIKEIRTYIGNGVMLKKKLKEGKYEL